jgi:SAM-dependent methyltransferase
VALFGRLGRKAAAASAGAPAAPDYKRAWNDAARHDAHDAILTGATAESFERTGEADAAEIRRHLPPNVPASVLNIGCGVGRVEKYLAPHVREMWAVDVSGEMIARAQERLAGLPAVRLREIGNDEYLRSFEANHFDLVFSYLVLQHLAREDAFAYLRDAFRVLKPGGKLLVQFPNFLSPEYTRAFLEGAAAFPRSPGRVRFYTETEARHIVALAGFEVEQLRLSSGERGDTEIYVSARKP